MIHRSRIVRARLEKQDYQKDTWYNVAGILLRSDGTLSDKHFGPAKLMYRSSVKPSRTSLVPHTVLWESRDRPVRLVVHQAHKKAKVSGMRLKKDAYYRITFLTGEVEKSVTFKHTQVCHLSLPITTHKVVVCRMTTTSSKFARLPRRACSTAPFFKYLKLKRQMGPQDSQQHQVNSY